MRPFPTLLLSSVAVLSAVPVALGMAPGGPRTATPLAHAAVVSSVRGEAPAADATDDVGSDAPLPAWVPVIPLPFVWQLLPADQPADPADPADYKIPIQGKVISPFGRRDGGERHDGIDIKGVDHAPISASFPGHVVQAGSGESGYGITVTIDVGKGITVLYAHLSAVTVRAGQDVQAGDQVGVEGQTGRATTAHLHYEIRVNGRPVNPAPYLGH
ncbi:MAG TPA: M23 family metallopeptidase [Acidimicrobiales bacterium]